jgi:hypothetical protein
MLQIGSRNDSGINDLKRENKNWRIVETDPEILEEE